MKKRIICSIVIVMVVLAATMVGYATIQNDPPQERVQVEITVPKPPVKIDVPTKEELQERHLEQCAQVYPTATKIWRYMREELGWNNYVCAGVMGNIMAECGGQTFNIRSTLYDSSGNYYGICQWSKRWNPSVIDTDLDFQLKYIKGTVESEFETFGYLYQKGFDYEQFTKLKDEEEAALAFAASYERCSSKTYYIRKENAVKAYNYFVFTN